MPRSPRTVALPLLRAIEAALRPCGVTRETFERATGLVDGECGAAWVRAGATEYRRALRLLCEAAPPPSRDRLGAACVEFPELLAAVVNAATLRHALTCFASYQPLVNQLADMALCEDGAGARVVWTADADPGDAGALALLMFELLGQLIRGYGAGSATRFSVALTGAAPPRAKRAAWEEFFRGPVSYGAPENALAFPRAELDRTGPHNRAAQPILAARLETRLRELTDGASVADRIARVLRQELAAGIPDLGAERVLARIRDECGLDARALRRELAREQITLRALVNRVKLEEARRLLRETSLSLAEVSERLGFNSQSSLTRFFRNQAGLAPLAFRKRAGLDPEPRPAPDSRSCRASRCCRRGS